MNAEEAKQKAFAQDLLEVKAVFDKRKIKCWLRGGTLLGAVRDKKFIPWDRDIDLSILADDWDPEILKVFEALDFVKCKEWVFYPRKVSGVRLRRRTPREGVIPPPVWSEVSIRLEHYYQPEDIYVCLLESANDHTCFTPARYFRDDVFIDFLGTKFRVPNPPEEFLVSHYGETWRTPYKNWHIDGRKDWEFEVSLGKYLKWFNAYPKGKWLKYEKYEANAEAFSRDGFTASVARVVLSKAHLTAWDAWHLFCCAKEIPDQGTYLEIGSALGGSVVCAFLATMFSGSVVKLISIDPYPKIMRTNGAVADAFLKNTQWIPSFTHIKETSDMAKDRIADGSIDLLFIDGDHSYEQTKRDIENYLPKVKERGVLLGHNYEKKRHPGVRKAVNEIFGEQGFTLLENSSIYMKRRGE